MSSRHQKKSRTLKKRAKKRSVGPAAGGGELQGTHGTMTGMVRGFRRVAGAGSAEERSKVGTILLVTIVAALAVALAIGLSS